jgi:acetylornithine deacetylase/succinyl-diaminopimelate desuccinylase-like protein
MAPLRALTYARRHHPRFLAELKEFVRFPTVGSDPRRAGDLKKCAAWLAGQLHRAGLQRVRVVPSGGPPVVYGAWMRAPGRPTVLVYGHYDVQPADPLDEWHTPPFHPSVRGAYLHGRGACDDKGQLFAHIKALESYLMTGSGLPVNVKCVFEGEEEVGSPHFASFVEKNKSALAADTAVISDTRILGPDRPAITYAERGMLQLELEIHGPHQDLHSGNFGGAVHNPLQALCEIVAGMHDTNGRVTIPGFYDSVRAVSETERGDMANHGPGDARILADAQVEKGWGESGYSLYERTTLRPALTVNGLVGGYRGPGVKSVIPARALAKLSFRLVPDQDPAEVGRLLRDYVARVTPAAVKSTVRIFSGARPAIVQRDHPALLAAAIAYRKGFGVPPVFLRSGGTIPVVDHFRRILGIPTVLMGFALPGDRIHAPNEQFHLPTFYNGIATCIWFLAAAATKLGQPRLPRGRAEWSAAYGD